jgi:hypothetical protein
MLTNSHSFRSSRLQVAVLNDVASHAGRLYAHTELGRAVSQITMFSMPGSNAFDNCLAELLASYGDQPSADDIG